MTFPKIATLEGTSLPPNFKYKPYIGKKRRSSTPTAGATVVQVAATDQIVVGDFIAFSCEAMKPSEFEDLLDKYNTTGDTLYTLVGYWGETLEVSIPSLEVEKIQASLFSVTGLFQVMEVTVAYNNIPCPF